MRSTFNASGGSAGPEPRRPKVIGIIGGMGPEATADLFWRIVRLVPASKDQDHPRVLIDSNAQIPDRTAAIKGEGPSPLPMLVETARGLERAGAEVLAMPCNSAHYWYDEIAAAVRVPVLHMIRLAAAATRQALEERVGRLGTPVLLLATTGTVLGGTYQRAFEEEGLRLVVPEAAVQERVMEAIYRVKAGQRAVARPLALDALARETLRLAPGAVVLGCTELPLVLRREDTAVPLIDSTEVLARAVVEYAVGSVAEEAAGT
ncbi:MAG: amino acid racemase [Limnochordaceae bacterium]|nr:amino acid racemase [Limnochordaceae bacterium]